MMPRFELILLVILVSTLTSATEEPPPTRPVDDFGFTEDDIVGHTEPPEANRTGHECKKKLRGRCVKNHIPCPVKKPYETDPGNPYCCSKERRCCYKGYRDVKHLDDLTLQEVWLLCLLQFDRPFADRLTYRGKENYVFHLDNEEHDPDEDSTVIIIPALDHFVTNIHGFDKLLKYPKGKNNIVTFLDPDVNDALYELYCVYLQFPGAKGILKVAVNGKDYVNEYIQIQALMLALRNDIETIEFSLPPYYDVFPELFMGPERNCHALGGCCKQKDGQKSRIHSYNKRQEQEDGACLKIDAYNQDLTNDEWKVSYYREDSLYNYYHGSWHLYNPWSARNLTIARGELFFYFHTQLLARYDMERLSNNLEPVKPLSKWSNKYIIPENYIPSLLTEFPERCSSRRASDKVTTQTLKSFPMLRTQRVNLKKHIARGSLTLGDGSTVDILNDNGTGYLGCALEAARCGGFDTSRSGPHYGSIHNMGHVILSRLGCPRVTGRPRGVMLNTWSAVRDPIFFRWHKFVDSIVQTQKKRLPPHGLTRLLVDEITIEEIEVYSKDESEEGKLSTFDSTMQLSLWWNQTHDKCIQQPHHNHKPFTYNFTVNFNSHTRDDEEVNVTVRIYMAPKIFSSRYNKQRSFWILMDRFTTTLNEGTNIFGRGSCESSITSPPPLSLRELQALLNGDNNDLAAESYKASKCICGLPEHLLIPRGTTNGMPYQLFVYITKYEGNKEKPSHCSDKRCSDICCHDYTECMHPDGEPMGFPFDRPLSRLSGTKIKTIKDLEKKLSNAKLHEIKIFYDKSTILSERQCNT